MSIFRTEIEIPKSDFRISHENNIFLIGSCFTENIGQKLNNAGFNVEINSFGTQYNPISIANSIKLIIAKLQLQKDDFIFHENLWKSFYHYSSFNSPNESELIAKVNDKINYADIFLKSSKYLIITFGTAWIYRYKKTNKIVSNCHKIHANEFTRELLSVENIVEIYTDLINSVISYNSDIKIIFSVSPIRHLKDGAFGNQISKSTLILAINTLINNFNCTSYFPAYETFMDDLRDYRFYAEDMLHPSQSGINYVWKKFTESLMDKETLMIMSEVEKLNKFVTHRVNNKDSEMYKSFNNTMNNKIKELKTKYPFINL
ncbi:MAG: hypothetical protein A2046_04415 [Bacteroidetes bacterium GWA2_30_7]|nr:MAG: hypothetical protein A2046_04415 [Bacteroidetes bacterium GWA2_30_7]